VIPRDGDGYTQGLVFLGGRLFESTGQYARSSVRELDPATGAVLRSRPLPEQYFGEGLAAVGGKLVQLTWKEGVAFVIDPESLDVVGTHTYEGEGWGLCSDGTTVFMSNGTDTLYVRDPQSFAIVDRIPVTKSGFPLSGLNELECLGETILANVFLKDDIVRIDKKTGHVTGVINGYWLAGPGRRPTDPNAVLNGIAYEPTAGTLLVTGKLWPAIVEIALTRK
jgi:glutamine cyclotransferase